MTVVTRYSGVTVGGRAGYAYTRVGRLTGMAAGTAGTECLISG